MGIINILLGRMHLRKNNRERFFAVTTAALMLEGRTDIRLESMAGLVFNPVESQYFQNLENDLVDLLGISAVDTGTNYKLKDDGYGTRWLVLEDRDFDDLASTIHMVGEEITEHGYGDRLLAAVFVLEFTGKKAYWIYNIKRGTFHPFIPLGENERDNKNEMRMGSIMKNQNIPVEPKLEHWYSLRGIPF